LKPGDSVYYDSTSMHLVKAHGGKPAKILAVLISWAMRVHAFWNDEILMLSIGSRPWHRMSQTPFLLSRPRLPNTFFYGLITREPSIQDFNQSSSILCSI